MNNRNLLIIFIVLLAIYGVSQLTSNKRQSSFDADLITLDTMQVNSVVIKPKGSETEITLKREDDTWLVSNGQLSTEAVPSAVQSILGALTEIKAQRVVAKKSEKWADYEVDEGNGTRITVYRDEKVLEDFIVGRFSFNQQARSGTSYVRINGEDEVYAVDGFLTLTFSQGFDSYRNKTILKLDAGQEITALRFQYGDTTHSLQKAGDQWQIDDGEPADSAAVVSYLSTLRNLSGVTFADDFDELQANNYRHRSITVTANNTMEPLTINCYLDTTRTEKPFVIRSSQRPDAFFASDTTGVYDRVFKEIDTFRAKAE